MAQISTTIKLPNTEERSISVERAGKLSDGIAQLRAAAVQCFNEYIAKHNLDSAEVDIMEEVMSDDEGAGTEGGKKRRQGGRKRKASAKAGNGLLSRS